MAPAYNYSKHMYYIQLHITCVKTNLSSVEIPYLLKLSSNPFTFSLQCWRFLTLTLLYKNVSEQMESPIEIPHER